MDKDVERLNKLLDEEFPNLTVGEKEDLVIRQWITYIKFHLEKAPNEQIKFVVQKRGEQILRLI